jgi:hypothetical protein
MACKTKSPELQIKLEEWAAAAAAVMASAPGSEERVQLAKAFAISFVPPDVSEDDIEHFSTNLASDEVSCLTQVCNFGNLMHF